VNALDTSPELHELVRRHLRFGWIGLLVFATLGAVLETLHAFKSGAYLGVGNETRRLLWTLAHAHGVGLSLLHIGFAATVKLAFAAPTPRLQRAASFVGLATVLLPGGFFFGGIATYDGDPGIGVVLAPVGAALLWIAILLVALELSAAKR
jgi:hypothetical protein